jgi:selenocysteine-specific elongation factor
VKRLAADGVLVVEGPLARLSGHEPILTEEEKVGLGSVMRELHRCGVEPPAPEDLARRLGLDRGLMNDLVRLLVDEGGIVAVSPGMLLSRESLDEALATVGAVLETSSPASPAEFREALGTSRRYLIPLLEYFDREGVTQRTPEGRVRGPGQST